mmetsp:Transcript_52536/g.152726  ORF Transcript_52536/g.152726 Transcript_52536/m.152726 type:complete len:215 (+) Transcript_52536:41-685(+)
MLFKSGFGSLAPGCVRKLSPARRRQASAAGRILTEESAPGKPMRAATPRVSKMHRTATKYSSAVETSLSIRARFPSKEVAPPSSPTTSSPKLPIQKVPSFIATQSFPRSVRMPISRASRAVSGSSRSATAMSALANCTRWAQLRRATWPQSMRPNRPSSSSRIFPAWGSPLKNPSSKIHLACTSNIWCTSWCTFTGRGLRTYSIGAPIQPSDQL